MSFNFNTFMEGEIKKYISQKVGSKNELLQATACLNPKLREMFGYTKAWIDATGDKTLEPFLSLLIIMGRTQWNRDVLTDLGLFLGEQDFEFLDLDKLGITKS